VARFIFEESIVLPTTPDHAFAIVGDPANGPAIDPMIERYEPEGGVMHVGGINRIQGRVWGLPIRVISKTREWDPPHRMVLEQIKPAFPAKMILTQTFEACADGTLLTYRAELEGIALAAATARRFVAQNFRRAAPRLLQLVQKLNRAPSAQALPEPDSR
jgi:hypothetical protein